MFYECRIKFSSTYRLRSPLGRRRERSIKHYDPCIHLVFPKLSLHFSCMHTYCGDSWFLLLTRRYRPGHVLPVVVFLDSYLHILYLFRIFFFLIYFHMFLLFSCFSFLYQHSISLPAQLAAPWTCRPCALHALHACKRRACTNGYIVILEIK